MKYVIICFCLAFTFSLNAQIELKNELFIKAGLSIANNGLSEFYRGERYGFHAGLSQTLLNYKKFTLEGEVLFNQKGFVFENVDVPPFGFLDFKFRLNYIDVGLFTLYKISPKFDVFAGAQMSFMTSYHVNDPNSLIIYENPNKMEFAPLGGVQYQWHKRLRSYLKYTHGTWSQQCFFAAKNSVIVLGTSFCINPEYKGI